MKKYLLLVKRTNAMGISYVARKTIYANSKKEAAEGFSRMLGEKVPATKVIDIAKVIADNQEKIAEATKPVEESKVELPEDIKGEIQSEDKPSE